MDFTVAAVVITYNRLGMLKNCVEKLRMQTRKLDAIFIINNGSANDTVKWLDEQDGLLVIHQQNVGSAGGFARGVEEAYIKGYDWIWTLDDDTYPLDDGLEILLGYTHISKCINGLKKYDNNDEVQALEHFIDYTNAFHYGGKNLSDITSKEFYFTTTGCWEGMLIHRTVVEKIGFPNKDYFINGDDTMYGCMACRYTNLITVCRSVLIKTIYKTKEKGLKGKPLDFSANHVYYEFRNRFLVRKELREKMGYPVKGFYREHFYQSRKLFTSALLSFRFDYMYSLILATIHGMSNRFGKR